MKILLLSDLHLEFDNHRIDTSNADVIVLAGDIGEKSKGVRWALKQSDKPIIYVLERYDIDVFSQA